MIKLIASASVLALMASAAQAQTFDGPYIGGEVGYVTGTADLDWRLGGGFTGSDELDYDGWDIGAFAGFRRQFPNNFVLGVELGGNYSDVDGSSSNVFFNGSGRDASIEKDWEIFLSGKMGAVVQPNLQVYVIGGLQTADMEVQWSEPGYSASSSDWKWGLHLGLGAEYMLANNVSVRGEYKYQAYDDLSLRDINGDRVKFDPSESVFRLGVAFNF
jgi:outer membrane immunogenic protein